MKVDYAHPLFALPRSFCRLVLSFTLSLDGRERRTITILTKVAGYSQRGVNILSAGVVCPLLDSSGTI